MTAATGGPATPYSFNNDEPTATDLLGALGQMLDEFTRARLVRAGVTTGARCLEVGAGAGTPHPGVTVLRHNVVTDPLPDGSFDVIHARAVLQHLPQRESVLARLAAALTPGGALIVEELEARWSTAVLTTPDPRAHDVFAAYETAMINVLRSNGNDPTWCRKVHGAMRDIGLAEVDTEGWQRSWPGGTGVCLLAWSGSTELHDRLVDVGMAADDLELMRRLVLDPRLVMRGLLLVSTTGRKPQ